MTEHEKHIIQKAIEVAFWIGRSHAFTQSEESGRAIRGELEQLKESTWANLHRTNEGLQCSECGQFFTYEEMVVTMDEDYCSTCHFNMMESVD